MALRINPGLVRPNMEQDLDYQDVMRGLQKPMNHNIKSLFGSQGMPINVTVPADGLIHEYSLFNVVERLAVEAQKPIANELIVTASQIVYPVGGAADFDMKLRLRFGAYGSFSQALLDIGQDVIASVPGSHVDGAVLCTNNTGAPVPINVAGSVSYGPRKDSLNTLTTRLTPDPIPDVTQSDNFAVPSFAREVMILSSTLGMTGILYMDGTFYSVPWPIGPGLPTWIPIVPGTQELYFYNNMGAPIADPMAVFKLAL
jgi:hypothetical protein